MHHRSFDIEVENVAFNCRVLGNGEKAIVAFHGIGQNGNAWIPLCKNNPDLTIYAIDLPYHGQTMVKKTLHAINSSLILKLMTKLIEEAELNYFSLIGYSIGSKFCIPIFERYHEKIEHLWLLAPDIIGANIWYKIATYNTLTRRIFRVSMNSPGSIIYAGKKMTKYGLLHSEIMILLEKSLGSQEKRDVVYNTWISLKNLSWSFNHLKSILDKNDAGIVFVYGEKDQLIRLKNINKMSEKIKCLRVITLPCGHQSIIKNFADMMSLD